jgi:hypothetical protein
VAAGPGRRGPARGRDRGRLHRPGRRHLRRALRHPQPWPAGPGRPAPRARQPPPGRHRPRPRRPLLGPGPPGPRRRGRAGGGGPARAGPARGQADGGGGRRAGHHRPRRGAGRADRGLRAGAAGRPGRAGGRRGPRRLAGAGRRGGRGRGRGHGRARGRPRRRRRAGRPGRRRLLLRVGPEVREAVGGRYPAALATTRDGRPALDPAAGAAQALERAGVGQARVAGECTIDLEERFFSHRRDHGRTGRQAGLVALVPGGGR